MNKFQNGRTLTTPRIVSELINANASQPKQGGKWKRKICDILRERMKGYENGVIHENRQVENNFIMSFKFKQKSH